MMSPKKIIFITFFLLKFFLVNSQVTNFKEKFTLPAIVSETSGLLFFDGKIITHNDSGDNANLYEIDTLSGNLLRTISINNATNVDWEAITEDENHLYVADIGNNNGNRKDLTIYKVLKTDFKTDTNVLSQKITFNYEDQTDFSSKPNSNNFDAEAILFYENSLLIFTKNWANFQTNVYKIGINEGNYIANKVSNANIGGLVTDATILNNHIMLCGYDTNAIPFLIYINSNRNSGDDIFNKGFEKYSLINELGQGNQVEGIIGFENDKFYISREAVSNQFISLEQKLFEFKDARTASLSTRENSRANFSIFPNPVLDEISINFEEKIDRIIIFDTSGKKVFNKNSPQKKIDISILSKGIYFLKIEFFGNKSVLKKMIKL